jgi:uncharacterized spore protein YtfJ
MDIDGLLAKATDSLTASRSYGPVIERDGCTVIPAAFVIGGGGGGGGEGPAGPDGESTGSGNGGGHLGISWPYGAYVIRGDQVRWVPAIDATRVALAAIALLKLGLKLRSVGRLAKGPS